MELMATAKELLRELRDPTFWKK